MQGFRRCCERAVLSHSMQCSRSPNVEHTAMLTNSLQQVVIVLTEPSLDHGYMTTISHARSNSALDWVLLLGVALMWGASFLFIKFGVHDFAPTTVAWLRLLFGAATLALLPGARAKLRHRKDWGLVAVLGLTWMAVPFLLFSVAEQTIDSALAGMINGAAPPFTVIIAALWLRNRPTPLATVGLLIGFLGVVTVSLPSITGSAGLLGLGLVLLATVFYGVAFNLSEPLEERNGALAVIWRAQLVALVATTPSGLIGLQYSTPTWTGFASLVALGVVSTGIAFACFVILVGRVGATRASVATYLVPVVAVVLGALVARESIHPFSLVGIVLVLLGAVLTSLRGKRIQNRSAHDDRESGEPATGEPGEPAITAITVARSGDANMDAHKMTEGNDAGVGESSNCR